MNNPFEGKAVKFDTAEQLEHLAELARGYGLEVSQIEYNSLDVHFRKVNKTLNNYTNCYNTMNLPEIHYPDFIMNIEAAKESEIGIDYCKEVCSRNKSAFLCVAENGYYINFGHITTPTFKLINEAWKSAYYMLPPTPNPDPIARPEQPDMVNHPPHYTVNGIEVIDVIENYMLNYRLGNVVKYVLRSDLKGNRLQDLKKALWDLKREIEQSE